MVNTQKARVARVEAPLCKVKTAFKDRDYPRLQHKYPFLSSPQVAEVPDLDKEEENATLYLSEMGKISVEKLRENSVSPESKAIPSLGVATPSDSVEVVITSEVVTPSGIT
ncbi:hypothetical protein ACLOJK_005958 [Asimina triloba]